MKLNCATLQSIKSNFSASYVVVACLTPLFMNERAWAQPPLHKSQPFQELQTGDQTFNDSELDEPETEEPILIDDRDESRLEIAFSLGLAGLMSHPDDSAFESNKSGYLISPQALCIYSHKNWIADLGIGIMRSKVSGIAASVVSPYGPDKSSVNTSAATLTATAGYAFKSFLLLSPKILISFGADSSFAPWGKSQKPQVFTGGQMLVVRAHDASVWRYGLEVLSDSTVSQRQVSWFGLVVQYGVPLNLTP